jgi:hypothetical protein
VLIRRVPDAQLAVIVAAPALEAAPRFPPGQHDHARVGASQGDGDGIGN